MRRFLMAITCAALAGACQPKPGPDAPVRAIYAMTVEKLGQEATPPDAIPMSEDLKRQFDAAQAEADRRDEPFIDGDLAADCQDCSELTGLAITVKTPPSHGAAVVEARFNIHGEPRIVDWTMVETPQGWRVDNIVSNSGFDLRASIREELAPLPQASCAQERGAQAAATLVAACLEVSPATHAPCNVENSCALIEDEIRRSCAMLGETQKPPACATVH
ncbi:MAG TPA: hypothetical protein VG841_06395 [Caulobacterales bacterium]|nr:hypothetical protein [Caulobacterales bacterium]